MNNGFDKNLERSGKNPETGKISGKENNHIIGEEIWKFDENSEKSGKISGKENNHIICEQS